MGSNPQIKTQPVIYMEEILKEWETTINHLQIKEIEYYLLKERLFDREQEIIDNTDFKELYGKNNNDVRKKHLKKELGLLYNELKMLELCIDNDKRRITYLKELLRTKRAIKEGLNGL